MNATGAPVALVKVRCPHPGCAKVVANVYRQNGRIWWSGFHYVGVLDSARKRELRQLDWDATSRAPRDRIEGARLGTVVSFPFEAELLLSVYCRDHGRVVVDSTRATSATLEAERTGKRITVIGTASG